MADPFTSHLRLGRLCPVPGDSLDVLFAERGHLLPSSVFLNLALQHEDSVSAASMREFGGSTRPVAGTQQCPQNGTNDMTIIIIMTRWILQCSELLGGMGV